MKGKVFSLFSIRDDRFTKALEIGIGSKLNNIVVENEKICSLLLKKNCFNYHVSFIPNNKV